jgi:UDPglucose 6-dehydrogenase
MRKNGSCDAKLLHSVVRDIDDIAANEESTTKKVVVVKSTVPPGTTERLDADNLHIDVVFSPEFLTEANSFDDFKNQSRIILGGSRPATTMVKTMLRRAFPQTPIIKTGSKTAEMVKYFTNSFLATKVIFANEMYDVCRALEIDYDKVTEYALYDSRIGKSHLAVPGPDGDRGFGGHCFPKDVEALVHFAEALHVDPALLKIVLSINDKIRSDRNWEKMYGRAVSDE